MSIRRNPDGSVKTVYRGSLVEWRLADAETEDVLYKSEHNIQDLDVVMGTTAIFRRLALLNSVDGYPRSEISCTLAACGLGVGCIFSRTSRSFVDFCQSQTAIVTANAPSKPTPAPKVASPASKAEASPAAVKSRRNSEAANGNPSPVMNGNAPTVAVHGPNGTAPPAPPAAGAVANGVGAAAAAPRNASGNASPVRSPARKRKSQQGQAAAGVPGMPKGATQFLGSVWVPREVFSCSDLRARISGDNDEHFKHLLNTYKMVKLTFQGLPSEELAAEQQLRIVITCVNGDLTSFRSTLSVSNSGISAG